MNRWLSLDTCYIIFVLVILNCLNENKISLYIYFVYLSFIVDVLKFICIYFQNKQLQQQKITDDYVWYTSDCEVAL